MLIGLPSWPSYIALYLFRDGTGGLSYLVLDPPTSINGSAVLDPPTSINESTVLDPPMSINESSVLDLPMSINQENASDMAKGQPT